MRLFLKLHFKPHGAAADGGEVTGNLRVNSGPFGQTSAAVHPDASRAFPPVLLLYVCVEWMVFKAILLSELSHEAY